MAPMVSIAARWYGRSTRKTAAGVLKLSDRAFLAEVHKRMGDLLGELTLNSSPFVLPRSASSIPQRSSNTGLRWSATARTACTRSRVRGLNLGLRDVGALVEVLDEALRLGLDLGDAQVLAKYEKWRALDSLMVMGATDSLTRIFGIPGKTASAVRRLGMAGIQRTSWLKAFFMNEARGVSGDLPELLKA